MQAFSSFICTNSCVNRLRRHECMTLYFVFKWNRKWLVNWKFAPLLSTTLLVHESKLCSVFSWKWHVIITRNVQSTGQVFIVGSTRKLQWHKKKTFQTWGIQLSYPSMVILSEVIVWVLILKNHRVHPKIGHQYLVVNKSMEPERWRAMVMVGYIKKHIRG